MNKCKKCGKWMYSDNEKCRCEPYKIYYPAYFGEEKQTVYGHDFKDAVEKLAEKINCDDPIFDNDVFEENIIITDRDGVEKIFNCSAAVDVIYRAIEIKGELENGN